MQSRSRSRSRSSSGSGSSGHAAGRSPPPPPQQQRRGPSRFQASSAATAAPAAAAQQSRHQRLIVRKPPEPLRRAVAECLSSAAGSSSGGAESIRTFEDYLGSPSTIHFAYTVLLEHALAERDRSPPVMFRCVSLLKRYLFRYVPPLVTLRQIDSFCATLVEECRSSSKGAKEAAASPSPPTSVFASEGLVKSLTYIRAVVARHLPASSSPHYSSFTSSLRNKLLLSPQQHHHHYTAQADGKESARPATLPGLSTVDDTNGEFIATDVLKWRWMVSSKGTQLWVPSPVMTDSGGIARPQVETPECLEQGSGCMASAFPPADVLRATKNVMGGDAKTVKSHLQAVTTSKRAQPSPSSYGATLKRRPRPLFQYRCYSKQQPLRLSEGDVEDVITAVCSESEGGVQSSPTLPVVPSLTSNNQNGYVPEAANIAASVLIKLIFDMYLSDSRTAAPLTLFILQGMLSATAVSTRVRAFDLVFNLGVHAHLLEPTHSEEHDSSEELAAFGETPRAVAEFENWLLAVLSEMLLFLVQVEERHEGVWAAAMSSLLYLVCDRGRIRRHRLEAVDIRVLKVLLDVSRENAWAEEIRLRVIRMMSNLVYRVPSDSQPTLDVEKLEMIGGIETICRELEFSSCPEIKRNLFALILDYTACQLSNKAAVDFEAVAASLALAGGPESLGMALCHKLPGIAGRLAKCIAKALDRDIASGRLSLELLEEVTRLIDLLVDRYASVEEEFAELVSVTSGGDDALHLQARAWATLRALLHSGRLDYRQVGYLWLSRLLAIQVQSAGQKEVLEQAEDKSAVLVFLELLTSKRSLVRQGFLIVLERLLSNSQRWRTSVDHTKLVQLMNGALWHFISANDTHRLNVLQMCNLMLSQICIPGKPGTDGDAVSPPSSMSALLLRDGAAASKHLVSSMPTALFYWPLMQLAASTMDDITLSIAVGSGGGGNVPGGASDVRCALLLLLIGKCTLQQSALEEVGGEEFFRSLLDDTDARIAYYTASFLIKRMMVLEPDAYQRMLHDLVFKAQQCNNEKLLENPYLQLRGIFQLAATDPR